MLSQKELASLQNIISDDSKSFEDLKALLNSTFDKSIHFKIILTLNILIRDNQLNLSQEISSFFILYCLSNIEKNFTYFTSLAIDILKETKIRIKRIFLYELLNNTMQNHQMKIKDYIRNLEKNENFKNIEENINLNIQEMIKKWDNNKKKSDIYMTPIVYIENNNKNINNYILQLNSEKSLFNLYKSNYMSYYPFTYNESSNNLFKAEPIWLFPMFKHNFIWENNTYDKISYLLNQILSNNPLTKEESKYIISSITKNPNIIKNINFTPNQMMNLIEKDEALSFEILVIICKISLNE